MMSQQRFDFTQVEAECQQLQEQAEERELELRNRISSAEEERILAENQVKDLKENIFELEDQVEQHRAVNCHTNQAVLDMESMFVVFFSTEKCFLGMFLFKMFFFNCCKLETINVCHCRSGKEAGGAEIRSRTTT